MESTKAIWIWAGVGALAVAALLATAAFLKPGLPERADPADPAPAADPAEAPATAEAPAPTPEPDTEPEAGPTSPVEAELEEDLPYLEAITR